MQLLAPRSYKVRPEAMERCWLLRYETGPQGTWGRLMAPSGFQCHILELPWRGNRSNLSCILAGEYECRPHRSPRFGDVYILVDVQGRTFILTHTGNVAGDVALGWATHSHGCLLTGQRRGRLEVNGRLQNAVLLSRPAFDEFMADRAGKPFKLSIMETYHV